MARPCKGTEAGNRATERWKATMLKKYGSEEELKKVFREIGRKGGATPTKAPKGFAANPELARLAGYKGGRISRRTGVKNHEGKKQLKVENDGRD